MTTTIALPDELEARLRQEANEKHLSLEEFALGILTESLDRDPEFPTLDEVVAWIKAMPPARHGLRPASGSLAEALRSGPDDPEFDLGRWQTDWARVEAEMGTLTRQNDIAEGLG
ncbi:MAG: hypothetical protein R2844_18445 [Caldilineales bacterium]